MAIRINIETEFGIMIDDCYLRVENITLTKSNMIFSLRKYVEADKPFFNETVINCYYDLNGENPYKQAYSYIKTLEEFKEAEDC